MEIRVKFLLGQQKDFLLRVQKQSGLCNDELAEIAGIVPRSYRDWKREKLCMTLKAFKLFQKKYCIKLFEDEKDMVLRWRQYKKENGRKGGLVLFEKHGSPATLEGRRKGGAKALAILRQKGLIPQTKTFALPKGYNSNLAEFVGVLLGDGGITHGQVCVTLNREADAEYVKFVVGLGMKLFGEKPRLLPRKDSKAIEIYYNGVSLVNYLLRIGLKVGNKVKQQVDVPGWIKSSSCFKVACLRGLMDTDGGVFIHKYKVNGKLYKYKKVCFTNRSLPLLEFVQMTLQELELTPKIITKVENKKVWLYNVSEVNQYLKIVGTHNARLLKHEEGDSDGRREQFAKLPPV